MTNLSIWDGFEVADWDGDRQLFDSYFFLRKRVRFLFYHRRKFKIVCSIHFLLQIFPLSFAGDMKLDILMCTVKWRFRTATVRFLSHSVVLAGVTNISEHPAILQTNDSDATPCNMQAVDFDEDGDLDLVMSKGLDPPDVEKHLETTEELLESAEEFWQLFSSLLPLRFERYFERVLDELEERTGEQNPLQAFPDQVQQIADLDGDGRLDVLVAVTNSGEKTRRWRYFRRAAAGTFVEPWENPLAGIEIPDSFCSGLSQQEIHVADWNSDGLPDILVVDSFLGLGIRDFRDLRVWSYYQHVVDRDLRRNSHFKMYEDIHLSPLSSFVVQDWNEDGFEDVMVVQSAIVVRRKLGDGDGSGSYAGMNFSQGHMKEVVGFSLNVNG